MRKIIQLLLLAGTIILTRSSHAMLIAECAEMKYVESQATTIVKGEITNVEYRKDEKNHIHTYVSIRVDRYLRGEGAETLVIKQYGGIYEEGGATYTVSDADSPQFTVGQSGTLYLEQPDTPFYGGEYFTTVCATGMVPAAE